FLCASVSLWLVPTCSSNLPRRPAKPFLKPRTALAGTFRGQAVSADAALVKRCLSGDPVACRELVEQLQSDVLAVCRRLLAHLHDAEDVAQEVFLRVFRSLKRWDNTRPLRPWVL